MPVHSHEKADSSRFPRVAVVTHWFPKPSETFIGDELLALSGLGLPLSVFTLYGPWRGHLSPGLPDGFCSVTRLGCRAAGRILMDLFRAGRTHGIAARKLWREVPFRKWSDWEMAGENLWAFLCGFSLARRVAEGHFDFLYAPWANGPATAAWTASRLTGIPFGFSTWAGDILPPDGALAEKIAAAAFVRSTSRAFLPHLQQHAGPHADRLHVLYGVVDVHRAKPVPVPGNSRLRLLALGRFVAKKGFDVLLRACALLQREGLDFHLTLAGGGPQSPRLRRLARRLGIHDRVSFPGFVPRDGTARLFNEADLFIMPSIVDPAGDRDGIPTVILEALLHEVPVVATSVGGIEEVVRDGDTGCLVPAGDPPALAAAVRQLAAAPAQARRLAERGRERVRREFDPQTNARRLLDLIVAGTERRHG